MNATSQPAEASVLAKGPRQYLTFLLEDRVYGVPLADVAEISPNRELNRMPHMPKGVEGLLDLRGTMLPVMSLRARLDLPPLPAEKARSILVLNHGGQLMGLLVDQVSSVLTSSSEAHVAAGPLLAGRSGAWVSGFLLEGDQIIV
ncbi:MAG: chemotaxis protein CheW, partial [Firmicutes bacterium]|nr:chemotaxis protein CheW [Bacillota bacterium]